MKASNTLYALLLCLISISYATAQPGDDLIKVRSGSSLGALPRATRFRFPQFSEGTIYNINHKSWVVERLNYDFYLAQMVSIINAKDTIVVKDLSEFRYFEIGSTVFIHLHNKGYYEVLESNDSLKLCVKEIYRMKRKERHANNGYGDFNDQTTAFRSNTRSDIVLEKKHLYYLAGKDDDLVLANRAHFNKLFPLHESEIKEYERTHKTKFDSQKDLQSLFEYCLQLEKK